MENVNNNTKNTVRNMKWGLVYQVVLLLFPFIIRTIILRYLGEEYIGLSSLFTSILNIMNIAELGFSSAIIFNMYEPIGKHDTPTIRALLAFYKKIYQTIGLIVTVVGLAIMPFLDSFIKGSYPNDINLYVLYLTYLLNTVLGYFLFSYKTSLLTAYHRNDIINKNSIIVTVLQYILQIAIILIFRNYHVYLLILPLATILTNLFNHFSSKKLFPECYCEGKITDKEKQNIKKQVKGILVSKISFMLRNSLANIIISAFVGLTYVAMYSNYYFIMTAIHGVLTIIGVSMKAGVGINLIRETKENNYAIFKKLTFMYMWIAGWFSCCLLCLYQPFMLLWTGESEMVFKDYVMIMFPIYFFILCLQDIRNVFLDTAGLHWEVRYRALLESIVHVILCFVLGYFYDVFGILLATVITYITINLTYGTKILFDHYFTEQKVTQYLWLQCKYTIVTIITAIICYLICNLLPFEGIIDILVRAIICAILPNILFLILYCREKEFKESKKFVFNRILKRA